MSDSKRLKELRKEPYKVKQHGGCCGFAAALMGLLVHAPKEVDALYDTVSKGKSYRGIVKSIRVKDRLKKRVTGKLLDPKAANFLDARLSIGLMILLKEYLKETGKEEVWEGCKTYSQVFANWQYGGKLKALPKLESASQLYPFSYKHGDLALTIQALRWLLTMVGFGMVDGDSLLPNKTLENKKNSLDSMIGDKTLNENLKRLVSMVNGGVYAGGVIGVAKKAFIGEKAQAPYEYISHWVYLPKQSKPLPKIWDTVTWTWGEKWTLHQLLKHQRKYVPKHALVFKKPGSGMMFL